MMNIYNFWIHIKYNTMNNMYFPIDGTMLLPLRGDGLRDKHTYVAISTLPIAMLWADSNTAPMGRSKYRED